ncbi:RING finger [Lecanosticta acicola]|uniref:RING finger n=1 Tax=Lecanosticta acicola TaxID=111012 RepID=A0AAI9EDA8_9PEZI|nr:RING finger [Lecanosticta acicola]
MGQGSSQPAAERRAPQRAERPRRAASTAIRRALRPHSLSGRNQDGLDDGLLNSERRRRPRPRSVNANRLSHLFRSSDDDDAGPDEMPHVQEERLEPARGSALLHRTRSRFHEVFRRESSHTSSRPSHHLLQHRTSYVRSGQHSSHGDDFFPPPRLPSIDLTSSFDPEPFASQPEPEQSMPRNEISRRATTRFNALRPDRPFRHLTSSLRRRRSPPPSVSSMRPRGNEDQAAMLSRLLSVAAAATAATLMGDDHNALSEARSLTGSTGLGDLGGNGEDGSFDGFLRALQNGRIASALRQGGSDTGGDGPGTQGAPLNFFRMFRFGASGGTDNAQHPRESAVTGESSDSGANEGRMVPIIIVGIRSISPNSSANPGPPNDDLPPFIDALGNFPAPLPANALGTHGHDSIDSILRPPQNGTSFRHRRRASMGGFGMGRSRLSDRMDDQRDHRSPDRRRERPWSMASSSSTFEPRPPPATPASPSPELSRISSRNTTPSHSRPTSLVANNVRDFSNDSRRNSILHRSSAASPLSSHTEETASLHSTHSGTGLLGEPEPYRVHRRSDTAPNIHYPRFASGHPRRNGVVEPDNVPPLSRSSTSDDGESSNENRNSNNDSRSWIIYVLGGSYPENHPILTTPSLFTENPTYEDMMLLSALLGPAKAPVATEEDVQSAGGIYNIETPQMSEDAAKTAALVATAVEGDDQVTLDIGQRCLVCLCDFETKEVARRLVKCNHLFHKECIDQWLTTGRNSCPLCREEGVKETKTESADDEADDSAAESSGEDTIAGAEHAELERVDSVAT